ncbi:mucin-1-like [Melitaea cinxia]|uniref:mucin-1-like n=1 Tax=Melitaea cinxia TaxID=113334 RepID=UPI001E2713D8|nr:mucin-1-like [Melitaea cinxia]
MLVHLLILSIVAQAYGRPQEISPSDDRIRIPDPNCIRDHQLLPHEYDCTKFYYCEEGYRHIKPRDCAPGTEFSESLEVCIHPTLANCTLPGVPTVSPSTAGPTTVSTAPPTPAPTSVPTLPSTQDPSPGETLPNGCPVDFSKELLLPHEYDCAQYYQCVHGNKIIRPCSFGSYFSYEHQDCVSPDIANCTLSGGPTGSPSTGAPTTRPTAPPTPSPTAAPTSPSTQRPSPGETLPNGCPADFSEELLLPHEYDCGQYYQCVHGNKILRPCAIGSHFSYIHQDCVSADIANCTLSGGPTGGPSTGAPATRPTAPPTPAPTPAPTSPSTQRPSPGETLPNGCPADFSEELLLPHEYDCGQYYQCVHGNKILRPCAIGSHFSYIHQDCVSADEANCTLSGGPTGGPSTGAPTTRPTAPPTPAPTGAPTSPSTQRPSPGETLPNGCPVDFGEELLLPHEYDCGQYYQCVHGNKILRPCAIGSHFSYIHQDCVSADEANCTLSGGPTGGPSTGAPTTRPTAPPTPAPTAAPTSPSTQRPSPGETLPNGCPVDFGEELLLPHEYDCGQYYQCVHGNKILRPCAIGSHFSYIHQDCVSADEANCTLSGGPTGGPSTGAPTTRPTAPPTPAPTPAPTSPSTQRPSPGETLPNGCPADFSEELLLPHEYDCGQYYQCVHGNKILRPCAIGSHFSYIHQDCVSADEANCTLSGGPTGGPSTGAPTTRPTAPPTPAPTPAPTSPSTQRPSPGETLPNGCPADFSEELLLPHEYDCGQYYQCVHGNKILRPCAIGSHFSYIHQDCVSADEANCTLSGGPTGGPSTGAPTTRPTAPPTPAPTGAPTSPSTQRPSPGETLPNGCPVDFGEELLLPHEYDCGQYYQCVHGNKILRPCAIGSHFSYSHQDCVSPDEANCTLSGGPTGGPSTGAPTTRPTVPPTPAPTGAPTAPSSQRPSPSTVAPTTSTTVPPTPSPTGAPTSPSTQRPSPGETLPNGCPADFGEELLLPHEYDCGQYYQCVHGNKIIRPCAVGSHFSYDHQGCVSPDVANCTLSGGPTGGPSTGAPTTRPTVPPTPAPTGAPTAPSSQRPSPSTGAPTTGPTVPPTPSPTGAPTSPSTQRPSPGETLPNGCPADFGEELLLPHEYDCGQYYQCVHGNKIIRPCAVGSHFSYDHQGCVSPDIANCTSSGGPTGSPSTGAPTTRPTVPPTPAPTGAPTAPSSQRPSPSTGAPTTGPTVPPTPAPTGAPTAPSSQRPSPSTGAPTTSPTVPPTPSPTGSPTSPSSQRPSPSTGAPTTGPTVPPTPAPTGAPTAPSSQRPSPSTGAPTTSPTVPPTPSPTGSPTSPSTQRPSPGETLPNGCPADFGEELLLPHEYDCGQYYQCVHGNKIIRPCAVGSHFSYDHQGCVSPDIANCTLSGGPTGGPSTGAPTTIPTAPPTPSPTGAPTSPSTPRPSPGETLPNGCPADFGEELLLPHEYDCGQYYQCVHGNKIIRPCAVGSHFSYDHQGCVSPDVANCTLSGGPTGGPSTDAPTTRPTVPPTPAPTGAPTAPSSQRPSPSTGAPTTGPTVPPTPSPTGAPTSPSTQRPSPGETLPNGCPADFGEELLLPHEYDCGQYYQCVHGNKILRPCSIGLHFSYKYQDCVYPEIANCSLAGGPTEVPPTNSPSTAAPTSKPTAPPTAPTTASTTTGAPTAGPSSPAPTAPPTVSPTGAPTEGPSSPAPTASPTTPPTGAPTGGPSSPAPTAPPTAPPTASTTSTTAAPGGGDGNDDKCKTGCNVPHWPHETDCDKFWSCNGDQKVLGVCSTGLHFNPQTQTCDFICNVSCERKTVQTNFNADGLSVFLPWEKVDELAEHNLSEIRNIGFDFL